MACEMSESYQYTPLKDPESQLRLISIHDGDTNDNLWCDINTFTQTTGYYWPQYDALSYAWGDASIKVPISLSGKRFLVTQNLEAALRNLRCSPQSLFPRVHYWIDAVSIDQGNTDERDQQVRRMRDIYETAARVVIWLGDYHEPKDDLLRVSDESWGIESLERGSRSSVLTAVKLLCEIVHSSADSLIWNESLECYPQAVWAQVAKLFHRDWFERLWIVQELGAASKAIVLCGNVDIAWLLIEKAARCILRPSAHLSTQPISTIFPRIGAHRVSQVSLRELLFDLKTGDILNVLHYTQEAKCTDPRDRLYAILGVVWGEGTADIDIDYSIPAETVYRRWVERRIRRTKTLDVLGACANSSRSGDLPSWVPDLRRPWGQDKTLWTYSLDGYIKSVDPSNEYTDMNNLNFFSECGMMLIANGQLLDPIRSVSSIGDVDTHLRDPTELTDSLLRVVTTWEAWASDSEALSEAGRERFRRVILRGPPDGYSYSLRDYKSEVCVYQTWRELLSSRATVLHLRDFEQSLLPKIQGCQMFLTESGNFGAVAGNCQAQVGDEIWVLYGGRTPFILRRTDQGHRLISPCYLAEHMKGFCCREMMLSGEFGFKYNQAQKVTLI